MSQVTSTNKRTERQSDKPDSSRLAIFFGLLAVFALLFVLVAEVSDISMISLAPGYMFTPFVAGLVVCLTNDIPVADVGVRVGRPRWLVLAGIGALPLVGVALLLAVAVPNVGFDPAVNPVPGIDLPPGILGVLAAFALIVGLGATVNAVLAFGEEFGWRGYLLWELAPLGFWKASALIGFCWGIWHAPVIVAGYNYPSFPYLGVGMMTIACIAFSPVYTYVVVKAESVIAAALLHGVFNGAAGLVLVYTVTDSAVLDELVASAGGVAGIVAFSLVALGIAIRGAPSLTRWPGY